MNFKDPKIWGPIAIIFILFFLISIFVVMKIKKENLSLSQFPIPTCSTCKSCQFYSCNSCGTLYQDANMENQPCDCGGFVTYQKNIKPSCYKQTLPQSTLDGLNLLIGNSCKTNCGIAADTYDSGATFDDDMPCPIPFPRVTKDFKPESHKQLMHFSLQDLYDVLDAGRLVIVADSGDKVELIYKLLIDATNTVNQGMPDLYYMDSAVIVMRKMGGKYYYMIGVPMNYTPENMPNFVNFTCNKKILGTMFKVGQQRINETGPVIIFAGDPQSVIEISKFACQPKGYPQSNTDWYDKKLVPKSCLNGAPYGSGAWTQRV